MEKLTGYSLNISIVIQIQHAILAKTYASETLLASVILHQNETQWVISMLWVCFARDLLLEPQLQREFIPFTGWNADALPKQIWSEPPFYYLQMYTYICKTAIPPHKAWFTESLSVQSMAHSFSWFFLIAKTSYRATPGYSQTPCKNKALSESPVGGPLLPPSRYNANSELPSKSDESCTFPTLSVFFFFFLWSKHEEKITLKVSWTQKFTRKLVSMIQ